MFIPDPGSEFFHPRVKKIPIPDPDPHQRFYVFLTQKIISSRARIPDPDIDFYPSRILDPGVKKAPDLGSGSATLPGSSVLFIGCLRKKRKLSYGNTQPIFKHESDQSKQFLGQFCILKH
jgi:hypothetical protein